MGVRSGGTISLNKVSDAYWEHRNSHEGEWVKVDAAFNLNGSGPLASWKSRL